MKTYGVVVKVRNTRGETAFTALTFTASNEGEAENLALEMAIQVFPRANGWFDHGARVAVVTEQQLRNIG
jgi:hypothetical protein